MEVVLEIPYFPFSDVDMGIQRACSKELHNAEAMPFVSPSRGLSLLIEKKLLPLQVLYLQEKHLLLPLRAS